jgi:hypothetical protein
MNDFFRAALVFALISAADAQETAPAGLVVIDLRPKVEKEGHALVPLEGKCNDDVYRIPDVATDPLKVDVLEADLTQMLAGTAEGKTLTVLNWSIYYNKQVSKGGLGINSVGVGGYSLPGTKKKERRPGSKCPRRESAGGWYQAEELTTLYFPLVSEFEGTYGGKPVSVRLVYSPRGKLAGEFTGAPEDTEALLDAVHQTAEAVATAIVR